MITEETVDVLQCFDKEYIDNNMYSMLSSLGNNINFEDNVWLCDKANKIPGIESNSKIYFSRIPNQYLNFVKYYVIISQMKLNSKKSSVGNIGRFLEYLVKYEEALPLASVNQSTIGRYRRYMDTRDISNATKAKNFYSIADFFWKLQGWDGMPTRIPVNKRVHMYRRKKSDNELKTKYIPDKVTKELDKIFSTDEVPVHFGLFYWFCRMYPSRCSEISSLKIDCLKPLGECFVFFKNEEKSSNDFGGSNLLDIHIKYEGMGKRLVDLYYEQRRVSEALQAEASEEFKGLLFLYNPITERYKVPKQQKRVCLVNGTIFNRYLAKIIKKKGLTNIIDSDVRITSHSFRHNGITDRLYEGFSPTSIRDLTGQKNDSEIISSYHYRKKEEIEKLQKDAIKKKYASSKDNSYVNPYNKEFNKFDYGFKLESSKVMFRGRIVNLDKEKEEKILANRRAYQISYSDKCIGICTEITSCSNGIFDCFNCDEFAPDSDELEFFKEQVNFWQERIVYFELKGNKYQADHAIGVKTLFETIVLRIEDVDE